MKRIPLQIGVAILAVGAVLILTGCSASSPEELHSVPASTEAADEGELNDSGGEEGGIVVGPTVFPDGVEFSCSDLDVSNLAPYGQKVAGSNGTVNVTTYSTCSADIDTNGDGQVSAVDGLTDSGFVVGGLLETVEGGQVDPSLLNDFDIWAQCITGTRADTAVAEGWDYASSCVDDAGGVSEITNLIVGTTLSGLPATLTCNVRAGAFSFDGREADVGWFCGSVLFEAFGGSYGD